MKKMYLYFYFLFFAVSITAVAQEQVPPPADPIRLYDGIPIISQGLHYDWVVYNPGAVDTMKNQAGVDVIFRNTEDINEMQVLTDSAQYPYRYGFKILPGKTLDYNYIQHYTNAKYSVWEAEGTPVEKGTQTLVYNTAKAETINSSYITRKGNIPNSIDHLISEGPKYPNLWQDIRYYASQDGNCDTVSYTTEFRLMLEPNSNGTPIEYNSEDTICIIQVTQSNLDFTCTDTIAEKVITLGDFSQLNQFYDFTFDEDYRLTSSECQGSAEFPDMPPTVFEGSQCPGAISMRHNIEYKVIWMGKSNPEGYPAYLLSVDKVTTSDIRGLELKGIIPSNAIANIQAQADTLGQYNPYVAGFIGIDEPRSPDLYEPIRKVKEILDEHTQRERPLWLYFAGADFYKNNFIKRVGSANIIYNTFLYDYPCKPEMICDGCPDGSEDFRDKNISWHANNIKAAYEIDPFFGLSVQCGAINPPYGPCNSLRNYMK